MIGPTTPPNGQPEQRFPTYLIEPEDYDAEDILVDLDSGGPAPIDVHSSDDVGNHRGRRPWRWIGSNRSGRARIGWSLVIAAIADCTAGIAAVVSGVNLVGLACSIAVGISSIALVLSEALGEVGRSRD